jgi:hypothetical protein
MTLRHISTGETWSAGEIWRGERIGGIAHPLNIEQLWSVEELAAVGLEQAPEPSLPPVIDAVERLFVLVAEPKALLAAHPDIAAALG